MDRDSCIAPVEQIKGREEEGLEPIVAICEYCVQLVYIEMHIAC